MSFTYAQNADASKTVNYTSVAMSADGHYQTAVTNQEGIYISTNFGQNWSLNTSDGTFYQNFMCVAMSADGHYQTAVAFDQFQGYIWTSNDYGSTWTPSSAPPTYWHSIAMSSTGQYQTALEQSGGIYISSNYGQTWYNTGYGANWYSVAMSADGKYQTAVANGNYIYTSDDFGSSWIAYNSIDTKNWYSVSMSADGTTRTAIDDKNLWNYYNDSWTINAGLPIKFWRGVAISADGTLQTAIVDKGGIWTSSDSGQNWLLPFTIPTQNNETINSVAMSADGTVITIVSNGVGIWNGTYPPPPPPAPSYPCFKENTKILCKMGGVERYLPIQYLRKGNLVKTLKNGYIPIEMIGTRSFKNPASNERIKDQLYVYSSDKHMDVFEDLIITGCHSILVDDFVDNIQRMKTIETLGKIYVTDNKYRLPACVDGNADIYKEKGEFNIYHIALENNDYYMNYGIYANGLLVETCSKRYLKELSGMKLIE